MKAVSFLSFAFMTASALAAPFQAEASSFEVSTRDMTAGNSVTTRSELVPNEKRIIDAASLISTLKDFQSSLGEPLSALDGLTKNAKGGSISKSEAIQKAQAQFAEVAEILGNLVSELTDLPGLEASRDDIKDIISLVKAFSEQLFGSSLKLISNVGFTPLFTSDFATILGHIVSVGQLLNDHLKDLAPRFLDQLRPLLTVLRPLFGYLRALLGGLGNGPIVTLFAQFLDKLIAF